MKLVKRYDSPSTHHWHQSPWLCIKGKHQSIIRPYTTGSDVIRACPTEILVLMKSMNIAFKCKKVIYSRKRLMNRKGERMLSDLLSRALKTSMTMHSFIISTNLLAALETHFDLWEDLLNLAALQQAIKIVTPYNKVVQITQPEHLAPSLSRKMPPSSLQSRHEYSSLARERLAMSNGFCSRGSLPPSVCDI